jgi:hypothetical protein
MSIKIQINRHHYIRLIADGPAHTEISARSPMSNEFNCIIVSGEVEKVAAKITAWQQSRTPIQIALPEFDANERKFILSGIPAAEFNAMFKDTEE